MSVHQHSGILEVSSVTLSTMPETTITFSIKTMERSETIQQFIGHSITVEEASTRCQVGERQLWRLVAKVRNARAKKIASAQALVHGNTGRVSNNTLESSVVNTIKRIATQKQYHDFGPTLLSEKLEEDHQVSVSREKLRTLLIQWKQWTPKPRHTSVPHQWRERKALFGALQQFDGCYHPWFEDRAPECCLLASIDDATGKITSLRFVHWEGVFPSFAFWRKYLEIYGKPLSIYLDRHSTYKVNAKTLLDDPEARTQFERAMDELNIEVIHAYSPEAKGRVERLFETLQDRLVKELRLQGISDWESAQRFVDRVFIPRFNAKFSVNAREEGDAHRPLVKEEQALFDQIFSIRVQRVVMNDFTVLYKKRFFQILPTKVRFVRTREKVEVRQDAEGTIRVLLRGAELPIKELPERPQKVHPKSRQRTVAQTPWKPPADHPWRRFSLTPKLAEAIPVH